LQLAFSTWLHAEGTKQLLTTEGMEESLKNKTSVFAVVKLS